MVLVRASEPQQGLLSIFKIDIDTEVVFLIVNVNPQQEIACLNFHHQSALVDPLCHQRELRIV